MRSRRDFLKTAAAGLAGLTVPYAFDIRALRAAAGVNRSSRHYIVESVDRVTLRVPFRPAPQRAMDRELPHWRYLEIFQVLLRSGVTGLGETMLYYTWGRTSDTEVDRALGKNAVDLMWDDKLGAGLQIALFDAVAKTAEVPVHRLLGRKIHDKTPLSWWNIDMAVEDMPGECAEAYKQGYMSYKTKGRPWFDVWKQVEESAKVVPPEFKIDMDFNSSLLTAEKGMPIIKELEKYPQIDIYESPIPQGDVAGNKAITEATRVNIALHYGTPSPEVCVQEGCCDGFVVGGGASSVMNQALFCAQVKMPFWLQLVGSGITAAFSLHMGAVSDQARWPAVNCHQLFTHSMLSQDIRVEDGFAKIPETPGLGYELDRDAVEKFRVDMPKERPNPARIVEVSWPDGRKMYFGAGRTNFMVALSGQPGNMPFYERGVDARLLPNDGSAEWRELYEKSREKPVMVKP